ncbi:MAG: lytic murein transglycosylase [Rhodopseudomonas sp.]|nr:lytic murein transglycosylase [Rhodopseudomonas sp.]
MRIAVLTATAGILGLTMAGPAQAAPRCQNTGDFNAWVTQFKQDAIAQGIAPRVIEAAAPELTFDPSVIKRDSAQAVFQRTFLDFAKLLIGDKRMAKGLAKISENAALFARIEKTYGVPREVLAAVWGLESDFGALFGKFKILPSLATLAYDCRRGDHFRAELLDALRIIQRGDRRVDQMTGNWAGEFGGMQFTPSNYIKYGVDFDGDGHIDLTDSVPDTLASAANYLSSIGWRRGEPWLQEVTVPRDMPWQEAGIDIQHPRSQWQRWGVRAAHGTLPQDDKPASLILPMGRLGPAFLAYDNFKVFLDWNSSYVYSTTVAYFATRLGGAPPVSDKGAKRVKQLTTEQMMDLQGQLAKRGYDVGKIDGRLGAGTRKAIKAMQVTFNLPADSWPTVELLTRLHGQNDTAPQPVAASATENPATPAAKATAQDSSQKTTPETVKPMAVAKAVADTAPAVTTIVTPMPRPAPHRRSAPRAKSSNVPPLARTAIQPLAPPGNVTVRVLTVRGCQVLTMPINRLREYRRC